GLALLITRNGDVWMFRRETRDKPFGAGSRLSAPVNTSHWDIPVWISNDGCVLCTRSQRTNDASTSMVWVRARREAPFDTTVPLLTWPNEIGTSLHFSADGMRMYLNTATLPGGRGGHDIWMYRRAPNKKAGSQAKWNTPAFEKWMKDMAALPAEEQVKAVNKKLIEMNPGFDGTIENRSIESNVVTRIDFRSDKVTDLSPLRALTRLKILTCPGSSPGQGKLSDLSPLEGLELTDLICYWTQVADLSPIRKMPLTKLDLANNPLSDISPLAGMPLKWLAISETKVSDASPLRGLPLTFLRCDGARLSDLSPLKDLPLTSLACDFNPQRDS